MCFFFYWDSVYKKFQSLGTKDEPLDKDSKISREVMYNLKELRVSTTEIYKNNKNDALL